MKRRNFCRQILYGSGGCVGAIATHVFQAPKARSAPRQGRQEQHQKSKHQWVVLYWMPYDNDLVRFGEPIVQMLLQGAQSSEVAVLIQSDYWGDATMRRRQILNGVITEFTVSHEDSSHQDTFSTYLDWAYNHFEAEHWGVIVVGHGGMLNQLSPDDHGAMSDDRTWMGLDQFCETLTHFNRRTRHRVELLFFQNCNKATLEVIYEAKQCAHYTLASQLELGAPNYYYSSFLKALSEMSSQETSGNASHSSIEVGREAALAIIHGERQDMYHTLTLVNNQAAERLPQQLSQVLDAISGSSSPLGVVSELPVSTYFGELQCDALSLLSYLVKIGDRGQAEFTAFTRFLTTSLIATYKTGGSLGHFTFTDSAHLDHLCGLSLYLPRTEVEIDRYHFLALSQTVDLTALYRKIGFS